MSQKDKVKELVGRGLNSYHTKALQQIERIEKKNKEQNHKISILTGELDKDYITKTAEGSVISLDHSKEGMVYLDELQGNTLVNYCTDGSKEMTLNGDIDIEGTFVTTTEGVDNGKIDVMCEGNTLVNLMPNINTDDKYYKHTAQYDWHTSPYRTNAHKLKPSTKYTVILDILEYTLTSENAFHLSVDHNNQNAFVENVYVKSKGHYVRTLTTKAELVDTMLAPRQQIAKADDGYIKYRMILLEGDWTDREVPQYFEGMKSVGQDDENGHKIEILSQNKNLLKNTSLSTKNEWTTFNGSIVEGVHNNKAIYATYVSTSQNYYDILQQVLHDKSKGIKKISGNKWYTLSFYAKGNGFVRTHIYPRIIDTSTKGIIDGVEINVLGDGHCNWDLTDEWVRHTYTFKTNSDMSTYGNVLFRLMPPSNGVENVAYISCPMIQEGKVATNFVNDLSNKKEILMNEPLRKANDFYRDRFVKIGSKWFIERNTKEVVLDGTQNAMISGTSVKDETLCRFDFTVDGLMKGSGKDKQFICDTLPYLFIHGLAGGSTTVVQECITNHSADENFLNMVIKKSRLETIDVAGLNKWLRNNNIKIVIPIATPIYEPLEIEPTLNTYNDITHISNNSIIPCNMKIQNTGYNAIIKPNTLYTVALDTNKGGTVGMNLGGAKGTTTNNVLKLTTPATLTDDSLRLYGKGMKGSKVRLLEGDKTNWIPSHFEGMKSSFEDKVQEDGSYKMEILMNNENLIPVPNMSFLSKVKGCWWNLEGTNSSMYNDIDKKTKLYFYAKKGKSYIITFDYKNLVTIQRLEYQNQEKVISLAESNLTNGKGKLRIVGDGKMSTFRLKSQIEDGSTPTEITNFMVVEEGVYSDKFIKNEQNKIQFSSIEPLRKWDRFVFKDGQLMIERGSATITFNGSESWSFNNTDGTTTNRYFLPNAFLGGTEGQNTNNTLCDKLVVHAWNQTAVLGITRNESSAFIYNKYITNTDDFKRWVSENNLHITYRLKEPTYEEIPFELQKIILEGYENGTLFFDTNIPPTSTVRYAGETPIVKATKLNKTEVSNNTVDINDNILPYLMDMDYRVVMLQLATEENEGEVSMARLFGGTYEMLKRDILSKRLSRQEYGYRLADYFNAGKLTEEQVRELEDLR